jgi:hypothetical protein
LTICGLFLIAEKLRVLAVSAHKRFWPYWVPSVPDRLWPFLPLKGHKRQYCNVLAHVSKFERIIVNYLLLENWAIRYW